VAYKNLIHYVDASCACMAPLWTAKQGVGGPGTSNISQTGVRDARDPPTIVQHFYPGLVLSGHSAYPVTNISCDKLTNSMFAVRKLG